MSVSENLAQTYEFAPQPPGSGTTESSEPPELAEVILMDQARPAEELSTVPEEGELAEVIPIDRARPVGRLATEQEREDEAQAVVLEAEKTDTTIKEEGLATKGLKHETKRRGGGGGGGGSWWECGCGCNRMAKLGNCRYTYG